MHTLCWNKVALDIISVNMLKQQLTYNSYIICQVNKILWTFFLFLEYPRTYDNIDSAAGLVWNLEKAMYESSFIGKGNTDSVCLHQKLLDLAAYKNVTQGTFLLATYNLGNKEIVCFQESDSFLGFMHNVASTKLPSSSLCYRIYTPDDMEKRADYLSKRAESIGSMRSNRTEHEGYFTAMSLCCEMFFSNYALYTSFEVKHCTNVESCCTPINSYSLLARGHIDK